MPGQLPRAEAEHTSPFVALRGRHELTRILALMRASPEAPAWPATAWESFLQSEGAPAHEPQRLLLAAMAVDTSLAGIVAVTCFEETAELELLLVHPAFRRQGLGRALSCAWLRWVEGSQAREAVLEVRASNRAAQRLYAELGFKADGRRPMYYQSPVEDALLMRRSLAEDAIAIASCVNSEPNPIAAAKGDT